MVYNTLTHVISGRTIEPLCSEFKEIFGSHVATEHYYHTTSQDNLNLWIFHAENGMGDHQFHFGTSTNITLELFNAKSKELGDVPLGEIYYSFYGIKNSDRLLTPHSPVTMMHIFYHIIEIGKEHIKIGDRIITDGITNDGKMPSAYDKKVKVYKSFGKRMIRSGKVEFEKTLIKEATDNYPEFSLDVYKRIS